MRLDFYTVRTFTEKIFSGLTVGVIPLENWLPEDMLKRIAVNNIGMHTVYFTHNTDGFYVRWFFGQKELIISYPGAVGVAHVLRTAFKFSKEEVNFYTRAGCLTVQIKTQLTTRNNIYTITLNAVEPQILHVSQKLKMNSFLQKAELMRVADVILIAGNTNYLNDINNKICSEISKEVNFSGTLAFSVRSDAGHIKAKCFLVNSTIREVNIVNHSLCSMILYWGRKLEKNSLDIFQETEPNISLMGRYSKKNVFVSALAKTYSAGYLLTR